MTDQELQKLLDILKYVPEDRRDETTNAVLKAAAIKFSQKELKLMPRKFRQLFRVQGMTARVYRRESGKGNQNYEIRLRTHGYNIYASSNNLEEAKHKFIDKLVEFEKYGDTKSTVPDTFIKFTEYFFDNFYSRNVVASTLRVAKSQFKNHLSLTSATFQFAELFPSNVRRCLTGWKNGERERQRRTYLRF